MGEAQDVVSPDYMGFRLAEEDRKPGDIEVPLQTITVQLPDEPLFVNGSPYEFQVNQERLAQAVNVARNTRRGLTLYEPTFDPLSLQISLGESLPAKILDQQKTEEPKIYDREDDALKITVPSEVSKKSMPNPLLAFHVTDSLNRDLSIGIEQVRESKLVQGKLASRFLGSMALGGAIGEAAGIATSSGTGEAVVDAIFGGMFGILVGGSIYLGKKANDYRGHNGQWINYKAQKTVSRLGVSKRLKEVFEEPVLKLVPAKAEPAQD